MDESQVKHLATVLSCVKEVTIDWAEVASLRGIARKDNAATSFKTMMKKAGVEYANNKFTLIDSPETPGNQTKVVKKTETPKKTATPRKRKSQMPTEDDDAAKAEPTSPTKKRKAKKSDTAAKDDIKKEVEEAAGEQTDEEV